MSRSKLTLQATLEVDLDDLASHQLYAEKPVLIIKDGFVPMRKFALEAIVASYEKELDDLEHIMAMNALSNNSYHTSGLQGKHRDQRIRLQKEYDSLKELLELED